MTTTSSCNTCGATVIQTPDGHHLNPQPHPLGPWQTNGQPINPRNWLANKEQGHQRHTCDPKRAANHTPGQEALDL